MIILLLDFTTLLVWYGFAELESFTHLSIHFFETVVNHVLSTLAKAKTSK